MRSPVERKILIIQKRLWSGSQRMSVKMRMLRILNWRGYLLRTAIQKSMSITWAARAGVLYLPWQRGRALPWRMTFHTRMRKEQKKQYSSQKTDSRNIIRRTETGQWNRSTHMMTRTVWKTACAIWASIHTLHQGMMKIKSGRRCFPVFTPL